mgnify:CR=1 FL=1
MKPLLLKYVTLAAWLLSTVAVCPQSLSRSELQNLRRIAESFERAGQLKQAADFYMRLSLANPRDISAYQGVKRACQEIGDWQRFREFVMRLQQERRDVRFAVDLAWVDYQLGDRDGARKSWLRLLDENPQDEEAYSLIGQTMMELQMYEDAEQIYQRGRRELKRPGVFAFELANLFGLLGRVEDMMEEYFIFLSANPTQIGFLQALIGQAHQTQQNADRLTAVLEKMVKKRSELSWAAHLLLGGLYEQERRFDRAYTNYYALEKLLLSIKADGRKLPYESGVFLYEFAENALAEGETLWSEQAYRTLAVEFVDSPYAGRAQSNIAQVYLANGKHAEAAEVLERFIAANPHAPEAQDVLMALGDLYLGPLFQVEKAEAAYTRAKEHRDGRKRDAVLLQLAQCATIRGDFAQAAQLLATVHQRGAGKNDDTAAKALYESALLELYQQHPQAAVDYVDQAQQAAQNAAHSMIENDVLQLSMLLYEGKRDSAGLAAWGKAKLLLLQRRYEEARLLLSSRIDEAPHSPIRDELQLALAELHRVLGDYAESIRGYASIYHDTEGLYRDHALFAMAAAYELMKENEQARFHYERLLAEFPNSIYLDQARKQIRLLERKVLP